MYKKDVTNILKHLGVLPGPPEPPATAPVELTGVIYLESGHNALWRGEVNAGERVRAGQKLAELGNSGYTAIPHFHFGVYSPDWRVSIPVRFARYFVPDGPAGWRETGGVPESGAVIYLP